MPSKPEQQLEIDLKNHRPTADETRRFDHRRSIIFLTAAIFLLLALTSPITSNAANAHSQLPADVAVFINDRANCDTLRGDIPEPDPTDPDNLDQVISAINHACRGTDERLKQLKQKYSDDDSLTNRLSGYEPRIEAIERGDN